MTFYIETIFPMGSWKWLVVALLCIGGGVWFHIRSPQKRTEHIGFWAAFLEMFGGLDQAVKAGLLLAIVVGTFNIVSRLVTWLTGPGN